MTAVAFAVHAHLSNVTERQTERFAVTIQIPIPILQPQFVQQYLVRFFLDVRLRSGAHFFF